MKYKPEPIIDKDIEDIGPKSPEEIYESTSKKDLKWDVEFEDGGFLFDKQEDAMIFCLLLEIRDLLEKVSKENEEEQLEKIPTVKSFKEIWDNEKDDEVWNRGVSKDDE